MITSLTSTRLGQVTIATATSSLTAPTYYWYLDGNYVGGNASGSWTFILAAASQAQIDAVDSTDPAFDPYASPPAAYPATRTLQFIRSIPAAAMAGGKYLIQQRKDGGAWTVIGTLADDGSWAFSFVTPRLADLSSYDWAVTAVDAAGNSQGWTYLAPETIVRTPDAPMFTTSFDPATTKVTFSA